MVGMLCVSFLEDHKHTVLSTRVHIEQFSICYTWEAHERRVHQLDAQSCFSYYLHNILLSKPIMQ